MTGTLYLAFFAWCEKHELSTDDLDFANQHEIMDFLDDILDEYFEAGMTEGRTIQTRIMEKENT